MLNIYKKNVIFNRNVDENLPLYYDNISVEGNTIQETRSGKNLLHINTTRTLNGVTVTNNNNGTITINGTATAAMDMWIANGNDYSSQAYKYDFDSGTSFTQRRNILSGTSTGAWGLRTLLYDSNSSSILWTLIRNDITYTTTFPGNTRAVELFIPAGATFTNLVMFPQLEVGTIATTPEEYGAQPSPDYPSDIQNVGYQNIFNKNATFNNVSAVKSEIDTGVRITETTTGTYKYAVLELGRGNLLGKTITISSNVSVSGQNIAGIYLYWGNSSNDAYQYYFGTQNSGEIAITRTIPTTMPSGADRLNLLLYANVTGTANVNDYVDYNNLQIEFSDKKHSYIPYGKYGIEVKTTGKNLLKLTQANGTYNELTFTQIDDNTFRVQGSTGNYARSKQLTDIFPELIEGEKYTFSVDVLEGTYVGNLPIAIYNADGTTRYNYFNLSASRLQHTQTIIPNNGIREIAFYIEANKTVDVTLRVMFEKNAEKTDYEPYLIHSNLIVLNEPLRSIGNVKDELYIKDNFLYVNRKIGSSILDDSNFVEGSTTGTNAYYITTNVDTLNDNSKILVMSNMFEPVSFTNRYNGKDAVYSQNGKVVLRTANNTSIDWSNNTNRKSWLNNNNPKIIYVLAESIEEKYELPIQQMIMDSLGYGTLSDVVSDPLITEELNGSYILEFEYMKNGKFSEYLVEENIVKAHGQPFSIYSIKKDLEDRIKILAKHWVINEWSKDFLIDVMPTSLPAHSALDWIQNRSINNSDINITGDCEISETARYVRKNMLDAIFNEDNSILKHFGGELSYNRNNVSLNSRRGSSSGIQIRQGKNITGAEFYLDFSTVVTRLVPVGKDGLMLDDLYVDSPIINNYATPIIKKVDVDTDSKEELEEYCEKLFSEGIDKPTISIKLDFVELSKTTEYNNYSSLETAHLGDTVTAYIPSLNLNLTTRIVKTIYNDNLGRITGLELGSITPNIAVSNVNVSKQVDNLTEQSSNMLLEAKKEASDLIKHPFAGHIYIDDNSGNLYIMDTTDINTAQNVWKWGLGGLGFSSTGINGTYEVAMTQDGKIVADFIKTGILQSVTIKATDGTIGGYKIEEDRLYAEVYGKYNFTDADLTKIMQYIMDEITLTPEEIELYDVNEDGVVNSADYQIIKLAIQGNVTPTKSAKIIMQTGQIALDNAYRIVDGDDNDIVHIGLGGIDVQYPSLNQRMAINGSALYFEDKNNGKSLSLGIACLPQVRLQNWFSTTPYELTWAANHLMLIILGKPSSSASIVSLMIPVSFLTTSNQKFQITDEVDYVQFNLKIDSSDEENIIITGVNRNNGGSIVAVYTFM